MDEAARWASGRAREKLGAVAALPGKVYCRMASTFLIAFYIIGQRKYFFFIDVVGFSAMLHMRGSLRGIKICGGAPSVSHLLFADDSLLLMEASASSAQEVERILNIYGSCSGQMINKDKTSILFS